MKNQSILDLVLSIFLLIACGKEEKKSDRKLKRLKHNSKQLLNRWL